VTSADAEPPTRTFDLVRGREAPVTNVELFFDLVYVFAVTQLSHHLLRHPTVAGAAQTGLLLVMVWLVWACTTWVTNWLDPDRLLVRLLLLTLMLAGLVLSAALSGAFARSGLIVGVAYAVMQIGQLLAGAVTAAETGAFLTAFAGSAGLW
jgi:low temperature requirement protein LtrA